MFDPWSMFIDVMKRILKGFGGFPCGPSPAVYAFPTLRSRSSRSSAFV